MRGAAGSTRRELLRRAVGGLAAAALPSLAAGQEARFFRIATGPVAGSTYAIGSLLAEAVSGPPGTPSCELGGSCGVPGLAALAQSSEGSLANLEALAAGRVESALVQADLAAAAAEGRGGFAEGGLAGRIRALGNLFVAAVHLLSRAEVAIEKVADLSGRRVGFEEPGAGTLPLVRLVLEAFGVAERGLEPAFLAPSQAVGGIQTGALDALVLVGGYPVPAVSELVRGTGARLLPVTGPAADALVRAHRYLGFHLIPFGVYPGLPAIETLGVGVTWLVTAELDETLAAALVAALWRPENLARLRAGHPLGRELAPEQALAGLTVPLHPGAARWYREQGLLDDP